MADKKSLESGFSLIEVLVGTAVFLIVALAAYNAFASLLQLAETGQARTLAIELADEQFEIIRNMPYTSVGLTNGIPPGVLPQTQMLTRGNYTFDVTTIIRNINLSTSTVQASDRLVEIDVDCPTCKSFQQIKLTGQVSPANLQSAASGGALVVHVFDANGQPVQGANVNVQSLATSSVQDNDITDNNGVLNVIGVPPGVDMYRITVSKNGYSSDRTYPIGDPGNPNPNNPDATVLDQQVTNVSFSIDKLSSLSFSSVSPECDLIPNIPFSVQGSKTIGNNALKYPPKNFATGNSGRLTLPNMEWDTYTVTPAASAYDASGINPVSPFSLNPGNAQNVQFVVLPSDPDSLMITVEDSSTKLPLSGASVQLTSPSGYNQTLITGQGFMSQSNWSHGPTQNGLFSDPDAYASDNGQIDTTSATSSGNINLFYSSFFGYNTNSPGYLESSTFDTGTTSNFYALDWAPANQPGGAGSQPARFQFATAMNYQGPWNYVGPDGTSNTYFAVPGGAINAAENGNEYARYKVYLTTATSTVTPLVSSVSFSYTSGCIPPGQVLFQGLSPGLYTATVSVNGYAAYSASINVNPGWQQALAPMQPN